MKVSISFVDSIINSDVTVKIILLGLLGLSVLSWGIFINKVKFFRLARRQMVAFEKKFWSGIMLEEFYKQSEGKLKNHLGKIFSTGMEEWSLSKVADASEAVEFIKKGVMLRVSESTNVALIEEGDKFSKYQDFLSTIVATAPFIGLFGTVWGVMNTFKSIAGSNTVTLNTIAPGIGEALVTTAIGILISICAIFISDYLETLKKEIISKMETFRLEFIAILSRELDEMSIMNYNKYRASKKQ